MRIDGGQTVALDHVAGGVWLSRALPPGYGDAIRGGDSLAVERPGAAPLRLHLRGSDATMFALIGLCLP